MRASMAPKVLSPTQNQQFSATRSVERILEDSELSGELLLCGRKLKDFPKVAPAAVAAAAPTTTSGRQPNLQDTVFAGNWDCAVPDGQMGRKT